MSQIFKKLLLALGSLLFILALLELGFRIKGYDRDFGRGARFHPQLGWTIDSEKIGCDGVNSLGFRFPDVPVSKPAGEKRLLVLGDSLSVGTSFPYDLTFPGLLERWLLGSGSSWNVINLSVGDWGNAQQLLALREIGLAYQPDAVVLQLFPFNDLCNDALRMADTCSLRDYLRPYLVPGPGGLDLTYQDPLLARLSRFSLLFGFVQNSRVWGLRRRQGLELGDRVTYAEYFRAHSERLGLPFGGGALASLQPEASQPPAVREGWAQMRAILREIRTLLDQHGLPLIAVVIPYSHTFSPYWENFEQTYPGLDPDQATRQVERFLEEMEVPTVAVRSRIHQGIWETADCFLMPRDSHLNAFGHSAVAAWLMDEMERLGTIPASPNRLWSEAWDVLNPEALSPALYNFSGVTQRRERRQIFGYGPESRLAFFLREPGTVRVDFEMEWEVADARVDFQSVQGDPATFYAAKRGERASGSFEFEASSGRNQIVLAYSNWVGKDDEDSSRRPLAVRFEELRLTVNPGRP